MHLVDRNVYLTKFYLCINKKREKERKRERLGVIMKKIWSKKTMLTLLGSGVLCLALLASGCGNNNSSQSQNDKQDGKTNILKVGTNATYVPFEFIQEKDGVKDYAGFDMDLSREIGKRLNMEVEFHSIPFDGLIPALASGEINMIASGMVMTPEREEKINFIHYYDSGLGILVDDKINDVHKLQDINGKRVAVQMGTTGSVAAHSVEGVTSIREFDHNSDALLEMKQGGADVVITAIPVAKAYLKTTQDTHAKLVEEPINTQKLGLGFSKNDTDLYNKVQKALEDIKADGTYEKLQKKWID